MDNTRTPIEKEYQELMEEYFQKAYGSLSEKIDNFSKFVSRQSLSIFLYKYELFKKILNIQGSIIECGVHIGGGTFTFAKLSSILEPINYQRKIIGFDTFEGFPECTPEDLATKNRSEFAYKGAFAVPNIEMDLQEGRRLYDMNRFINHIPKLSFVKGDINKTLPKFLEENPHTIISLLYLDLDIYKPTKTVLELVLPRMPKGSIIAFDQLNSEYWPGETKAVLDILTSLNKIKIQRFPFEPSRCYTIINEPLA